jgi:hypothetical protein
MMTEEYGQVAAPAERRMRAHDDIVKIGNALHGSLPYAV